MARHGAKGQAIGREHRGATRALQSRMPHTEASVLYPDMQRLRLYVSAAQENPNHLGMGSQGLLLSSLMYSSRRLPLLLSRLSTLFPPHLQRPQQAAQMRLSQRLMKAFRCVRLLFYLNSSLRERPAPVLS